MIGLSARHDPPLERRSIDLVLLALAVALLPHMTHLPLLVIVMFAALAAWRWTAAHRGWSLPGMPVRTLLTILALTGVFLSFGTVFGRDAGAALLVIMLGLKLLEVRRHRDAVIVVFLGYFLTVTMVLFSQEFMTFALLAIALLLLTVALMELNHPSSSENRRLRPLMKRSAILLAQALPLMLIMFVLFPRLPAPLWNLPEDAWSGMTGLSDSMSPGSISALGQSDSVAFRVSFEGTPPAQEQLYWRGPVFWHTDGRKWSPDGREDSTPIALESPAFTPAGPSIAYTVTLEPHDRRWLFALEMPATAPEGSRHSADLLLLANRPLRQLTRYRVESHMDYRAMRMTGGERVRALQLPDANPRARALGEQWRRQGGGSDAIVQRALDHFGAEPFHYTLNPPLLPGRDPLDDFLFTTRRGFCEHYAAAFTVLMRAAGVPARVVTGYQGGELNPIGDYLIVRQRDAHAWAEIWIDDRGWVRVDPTAAVAPHRIERGSRESLLDERSGMRNSFERGILGGMWRQARFGWDTLNNRWNLWVLGYGPDNQNTLLSRFGLRSWFGMTLTMLAAVGVLLLAIAFALLFRRGPGGDPAARLYERFCAKLARRGIHRAPAEGPVEFAARARDQRPDLAAAIDSINRRYVAIRYGGIGTMQQLRRLRREIALFRP